MDYPEIIRAESDVFNNRNEGIKTGRYGLTTKGFHNGLLERNRAFATSSISS